MGKKIIIILLVLLLCLASTLMILLKLNNIEVPSEGINEKDDSDVGKENGIEPKKQITAQDVIKVKNCINQYINTTYTNNSSYYMSDENGNAIKIVDDDEIKEKIYKLLSQKYIEENNITNENIFSYIDEITEKVLFDIVEIKFYENSNSNQYAVYGIIQDLKNNFIKDVYYIVNINEEYDIFSIEPLLKNDLNINEIEVKDTIINNNEENKVTTVNITNEYICKEYFNTYKRILLAKTEVAYNYLDEQYKLLKFKSVNSFIKYINEKRDVLKKVRLEKYNIEELEDRTEYTLIDQYENHYIINVDKYMKCTLMLDNYTIGNIEIQKKYDSTTEFEKAKLNITKFFTSINNKEYIYAYNRLDEVFKNNNFSKQEKFEKYIKENFFENNEIDCKNVNQEGDLYVFELVIINADDKTQRINKNLIIKIKEGYDFVLSFNME